MSQIPQKKNIVQLTGFTYETKGSQHDGSAIIDYGDLMSFNGTFESC